MNLASAVIFTLLFCHFVNYCGGSFLKEKTSLRERNIFEQFFAVVKLQTDRPNPRHMSIVGASGDHLREIKSFLEAVPYFIGNDARKICISREFAPYTPVIYFLANLEEDYLTKVIESLMHCERSDIYFIFEGLEVSDVEIDLTLRLAFDNMASLPYFIHHGKEFLKLYEYKLTMDCHMKAELMVDSLPRTKMDLRNCPVSVGTRNSLPWMSLAKDVYGVSRIVGGIDGNIISTIAQKMNFATLVHEFTLLENSTTHNSTVELVPSCAAGNTDIGVAHIRPTNQFIGLVDMSYSYMQEDVVWCVPRITHWKNNIITPEFSWSTWVFIGMTFLAGFVLEKIVRSTPDLNRGNANNSGYFRIILDLIGSTLGNPIVYRPFSIGGKFLLMIYVFYSMVITTAYKTSLSSILTVDNSVSSIVDIEGMIKANLTTGGNMYRLIILKDQAEENNLIPELIKRYEIEPNISKGLHRVLFDKNFAYLTSINELNYYKHIYAQAGTPVSFDVLNESVQTHNVVLIFPKTSRFTYPANYLIRHLVDSGLIEYWIKNITNPYGTGSGTEQSSEMKNTVEELQSLTQHKFHRIFYFYCIALSFCVLIFLGELIAHKLLSHG